jgi:hypothetical protein
MQVLFNGSVIMYDTWEGGCGTHGRGEGDPVDAMKAHMGSSGRLIAPLDGSEWSASGSGRFTASRYPLNRSLDGSQTRSGRFGEDRSLLPYRDSNHGPSSP